MQRPDFLPTPERISAMSRDPLRVMFSACLLGAPVVGDGRIFPVQPHLQELIDLPNVETLRYCPEDPVMGTPRLDPDCVGGNGFDVLDGGARFVGADGRDWTDGIIESAGEMARRSTAADVDVAILLHVSGACGSSVIYEGLRAEGRYQRGPGVAAAALIRAGIPVLSQRDFRTYRYLRAHVEPGWRPPADLPEIDHWEHPWCQSYFPEDGAGTDGATGQVPTEPGNDGAR